MINIPVSQQSTLRHGEGEKLSWHYITDIQHSWVQVPSPGDIKVMYPIQIQLPGPWKREDLFRGSSSLASSFLPSSLTCHFSVTSTFPSLHSKLTAKSCC